MCENCLYKRNCQYLAKHHHSIIDSCTAFKSEADLRAEVAMEIFEEIEKYVEVALMNGHIETPILCIGHSTFAELKKKYTEET